MARIWLPAPDGRTEGHSARIRSVGPLPPPFSRASPDHSNCHPRLPSGLSSSPASVGRPSQSPSPLAASRRPSVRVHCVRCQIHIGWKRERTATKRRREIGEDVRRRDRSIAECRAHRIVKSARTKKIRPDSSSSIIRSQMLNRRRRDSPRLAGPIAS